MDYHGADQTERSPSEPQPRRAGPWRCGKAHGPRARVGRGGSGFPATDVPTDARGGRSRGTVTSGGISWTRAMRLVVSG